MNSPIALDSGLVNHQVRLAARPKGLPQACLLYTSRCV